MKKIILFLLTVLLPYISSAQTGWGYVNYTSYKTHNGTGDQSQYNAFANNAAGFDAMMNTANSNTTITHTGEVPISYVYNGSSQIPRWNNDYFAYKIEFWFVPQQTGTYYFGINSDDASDLSMDGTIIVSYYGGHGASSWQTVPKSLVAGQQYRMVLRGQEYGGGESLYFMWYRPVGGWGYWNNEVTNTGLAATITSKLNFYFGGNINPSQWSVKTYTGNGASAVSSTNGLALGVNGSVNNSSDFNKSKTDMIAQLSHLSANTLQNMYTNVVTISDAYLAFQELSNNGLNGSESGNVFTNGIQFLNGDIDGNNVFDEKDSYKILQQATGASSIVSTWSEDNLFRLVGKTAFDGVTKANWKTLGVGYQAKYPLAVSTSNDYTYDIMVTLKGDVNQSHSATQNTPVTQSLNKVAIRQINSYVETELVGNEVHVNIKVNPLGEQLKGIQFKVNYDSDVLRFQKAEFQTSGNPQNFASDNGSYINLGSIITNLGTLDTTTEYKLLFSTKSVISNTLGLVTIQPIDAVNSDGQQITIKSI